MPLFKLRNTLSSEGELLLSLDSDVFLLGEICACSILALAEVTSLDLTLCQKLMVGMHKDENRGTLKQGGISLGMI